METGDAQVGGGPCAEAGYSGVDRGNAQVGGGPHAGAGTVVGLGASGWYGGKGAETGIRGVAIYVRKA